MFMLETLLNMPMLERGRIVAGEAGVKNAVISHVSVMEMPVENFIRPKELVLSTAIGCIDDPGLFLTFVTEIHKSGACALILSFKSARYDLPFEVIDYAQRHNFPIIRLPWDARFSEIVETCIGEIQNDSKQRFVGCTDLQKSLLKSFISGGNLFDAAEIIGKGLGCQCTILDSMAREIANFCENQPRFFDDYEPMRVEIQANSRVYGYVVLRFHRLGAECKRQDIRQYVSVPLMLWFDKENTITRTRLQVKDDFVWRLAKGDYSTQDDLLSDASLLGFSVSKPYCCVVGRLFPPENEASWHDYHMTSVKAEVLALAEEAAVSIMLTAHKEDLIFYFEGPLTVQEKKLDTFLDLVEERLKNSFQGLTFVWGISEFSDENPDFQQLYSNARLAQTLCINSKANYNRSTFEDTSIYKILSALAENAEIMELCHTVLLRLIDHDKEKGMLLDTVKHYIKNDKNVSLTAREMHLHRQSLLYRLRKIEELTGLDFTRHNDLFLLEICSRLYLDYSS